MIRTDPEVLFLAETDLDIEFLRRMLAEGVVGHQILHYDMLGSTMDEARRLAERGGPEGTVIVVEEQTVGRGRFDRPWISPRGQNLSFSVLLRPTATQLPYVNMAATLAVSRAVAEATALQPAIKWPNDVLINGRKVSGILIETAMDAGDVRHAIVGMGVNVNFDPSRFSEIASTATSISGEIGRKADRTGVLQAVLTQFDELYQAIQSGRSLKKDWAAMLDTLGRAVRVQWQDRVLEGRADAVDEQGNLILRRPDGSTFAVVAGEVTLQA